MSSEQPDRVFYPGGQVRVRQPRLISPVASSLSTFDVEASGGISGAFGPLDPDRLYERTVGELYLASCISTCVIESGDLDDSVLVGMLSCADFMLACRRMCTRLREQGLEYMGGCGFQYNGYELRIGMQTNYVVLTAMIKIH